MLQEKGVLQQRDRVATRALLQREPCCNTAPPRGHSAAQRSGAPAHAALQQSGVPLACNGSAAIS